MEDTGYSCEITESINTDKPQITRFYDELAAHIVVAGGSYHHPGYWANQTLDHVCRLIWPNGIRLKVYNETNNQR